MGEYPSGPSIIDYKSPQERDAERAESEKVMWKQKQGGDGYHDAREAERERDLSGDAAVSEHAGSSQGKQAASRS